MSSQYLIKDRTLTEIADAIRQKTGETDPILTNEFAEKILEIECVESGPNYFEGFYSGAVSGNQVAFQTDLNFRPKVIIAYNLYQLEGYGEDFTAYSGLIYIAIWEETLGQWIVAGPRGSSGTTCIYQETADIAHLVPYYSEALEKLIFYMSFGSSVQGVITSQEATFQVKIYG